jgi:hypothetical protein
MIQFVSKHPQFDAVEDVGFLPTFLYESDPRPAKEQFNERYNFGGGWNHLDGFTMLENGDMQYKSEPGEEQDPPTMLLAEAQFRDETIRLYQHAWVAIVQKDGSFEVSRMD